MSAFSVFLLVQQSHTALEEIQINTGTIKSNRNVYVCECLCLYSLFWKYWDNEVIFFLFFLIWRHLSLRSKDEYETTDHNFSFYFLMSTYRCNKAPKTFLFFALYRAICRNIIYTQSCSMEFQRLASISTYSIGMVITVTVLTDTVLFPPISP